MCIGDNIIKQVSDSYRKLRNTLRYLIGSLNDFEPSTDLIEVSQLASVDRYMLGKLSKTVAEVEQGYILRVGQSFEMVMGHTASSHLHGKWTHFRKNCMLSYKTWFVWFLSEL